MNYCPHCMRPTGGMVCEHCGRNVNWMADPGQLPVGSYLTGPQGTSYQIGAALGQGGFGVTYAAMELQGFSRVAIKEFYPVNYAARTGGTYISALHGQEQNFAKGIRNFMEEAMMLSAVGALPSVVTVLDCFEANGTAYLVMEFVDGAPLHHVVNQQGRFSANQLLPLLQGLMQDLEILHKAGVIHRDISPDNLIITQDGRIKLLDFGSARNYQDGRSLTMLLKAGFSPIEQYCSRGQGAWTDVYAMAATIYYCLTGVLPPTAVERLEGDTLQSPNAYGAGLTSNQEKALMRAFAIQPKQRYQSMSQFHRDMFPRSRGSHPTTTTAVRGSAYRDDRTVSLYSGDPYYRGEQAGSYQAEGYPQPKRGMDKRLLILLLAGIGTIVLLNIILIIILTS